MCNGDFLSKDPDEAIEYLNELAETWAGPSATDSINRSKPNGIYHLREEDNLKAQLNLVTRKIEALENKDSRSLSTRMTHLWRNTRSLRKNNVMLLGCFRSRTRYTQIPTILTRETIPILVGNLIPTNTHLLTLTIGNLRHHYKTLIPRPNIMLHHHDLH